MTLNPEAHPRSSHHARQPWARAMAWCVASLLLLMTGCRQDMQDQPRHDPLEASTLFEDRRSARPLVPHTVARGHLRDDEHLYTGKSGGAPVNILPFPITRAVLERGQERYNIFCMVVRRGFTRPSSLHADRLRQAPVGYFFDAITNGFGVMPSYAAQVSVRDRWAIVAYIRALQLSQRAALADVPAQERSRLQESRP
jgi:hypothetical protein